MPRLRSRSGSAGWRCATGSPSSSPAAAPPARSTPTPPHARRAPGAIQTSIPPGQRGAGSAVGPDELLRVPCDLDLASARDRDEAEELYAEQAGALRDALEAADTVLAVWQE